MAILRIVWGALGALALAAGAQARPLEFDDIAREGELRLLAERPDPHAYGYESRVRIDDDSLRTGVVRVETCHLRPLGDGRWRLHAGPLMRRYLDGFLPMEADLAVTWPDGLLSVAAVDPAPHPGVRLTAGPDGARLQVTFAGRLSARWELRRTAGPGAER